MNSCCAQPVEVIAADKHHNEEACCLVVEKTPAPARAACPISGTLSRKVQRRTLEHLLKPEKLGSLRDVQYYYCKEPTCNVVYFSNENAPFFSIEDVAVKVFAKDQGIGFPSFYDLLLRLDAGSHQAADHRNWEIQCRFRNRKRDQSWQLCMRHQKSQR